VLALEDGARGLFDRIVDAVKVARERPTARTNETKAKPPSKIAQKTKRAQTKPPTRAKKPERPLRLRHKPRRRVR